MTVKEVIEKLKQYDEDEQVWFYHKLKGKIMPAEIAGIVNKIEYTADGVLLS